MREKMKQWPVAVTILISLVCVGIFLAILDFSGPFINLFPLVDKYPDFYPQVLVEAIIFVVFLVIAAITGHMHIFKENKAGILPGLYTAGFFVGYCGLSLGSQLLINAITDVGPVREAFDLISFVLAILLVGIVEELVFRGVILNILLDRFPKTEKGILLAIIVNAVFFGGMHMNNMHAGAEFLPVLVQSLSATMLGLLFATIYVLTKNYWLVAFFHFLVDFCALISSGIFSKGGIIDHINGFQPISLIGVIVLLIPSLVLLRKSNRAKMVMVQTDAEYVITEADASKASVVSLICGIIGLLFSCIAYFGGVSLAGLIAALYSRKYKKNDNAIALVGLIVSIVACVLTLIIYIALIYLIASGQSEIKDMLNELLLQGQELSL